MLIKKQAPTRGAEEILLLGENLSVTELPKVGIQTEDQGEGNGSVPVEHRRLVSGINLLPGTALLLEPSQQFGKVPAGLDVRTQFVTHRTSYLGIAAHALFIPLFWFSGYPVLAALNVGSVAVWGLGRHLNRIGEQHLAVTVLSLEVVAHAIACVVTLGWASGFQFYILALIPYLLFYSLGKMWILTSAAGLAIAVLVWLFLAYGDQANGLPAPFRSAVYVTNLVIPTLMLGLISSFYREASARAERDMERLATLDPLTGLVNRRSMTQRLDDECRRTERGGAPFCVVMLDIDRFKRINDGFGHDVGDEVLTLVSRRLESALRQQDVVARWGGEEFLLLLVDTSLEAGAQVLQRLRALLSDRPFHLSVGDVVVTASFGITAYERGDALRDVMRAADEALYEAKTEGRDRVSIRARREARRPLG